MIRGLPRMFRLLLRYTLYLRDFWRLVPVMFAIFYIRMIIATHPGGLLHLRQRNYINLAIKEVSSVLNTHYWTISSKTQHAIYHLFHCYLCQKITQKQTNTTSPSKQNFLFPVPVQLIAKSVYHRPHRSSIFCFGRIQYGRHSRHSQSQSLSHSGHQRC